MTDFRAGMCGDVHGVEWRIVQGRKHPDDLRLDVRASTWVPVSMVLGYLLADFYAVNERTLYPYRGDKAGERYIFACQGAQRLGWEHAAEQLAFERAEARARRENAA